MKHQLLFRRQHTFMHREKNEATGTDGAPTSLMSWKRGNANRLGRWLQVTFSLPSRQKHMRHVLSFSWTWRKKFVTAKEMVNQWEHQYDKVLGRGKQ